MDQFTQVVPYLKVPAALRANLPICESVRFVRLEVGQQLSFDSAMITTSINGGSLKVQVWAEANMKDSYGALYCTVAKQVVVVKLMLKNAPIILFVNCGNFRCTTVVEYYPTPCVSHFDLGKADYYQHGYNIMNKDHFSKEGQFVRTTINAEHNIKSPELIKAYFTDNGDRTLNLRYEWPCIAWLYVVLPCFTVGCILDGCVGHDLPMKEVDNQFQTVVFGNVSLDFLTTYPVDVSNPDLLAGGVFEAWLAVEPRNQPYRPPAQSLPSQTQNPIQGTNEIVRS